MNVARALRVTMAMSVAALGLGACSSDLFDVNVALASHAYKVDFGTSSGTIPTVACDATMPNVCSSSPTLAVTTADTAMATASVNLGCDASTSRCYAVANASVTYELAVLQDDNFVTKVERHGITAVQGIDLVYTVPVNTLTFAVPRIDVYVGPDGSKTDQDPGVVFIDSVTSVAAGQTFVDQSHHLTVADGSAARALMINSIRAKAPFVFVVVTAPRIDAGQPVPGGSFELDVYPTLELGLE